MRLCGVVRRMYWGPRLDHLDRPWTTVRQQPQAHLHDAQEISGKDPAWGVDRGHGLRDEEPWPMPGEGRQGLEHPLEEELCLLIRDILIEEGGQRLQENY